MLRYHRARLFPWLAAGLVLSVVSGVTAAEPNDAGRIEPAAAEGEAAKTAEVELPQIRGTVSDAEQRPIAGATVRFLREGLSLFAPVPEPWLDPIVVRTDDEGRFTASGLDGKTFLYRVESSGFAPAGGEVESDAGTLAVTLGPGHPLTGTVRDEGTRKALEGAKVLACDPAGRKFGEEACATTATNDEGAFRFENLPAGKTIVRVRSSGYAVPGTIWTEIPRAEDAPPLRAYLRPGARILGRVLDGRDRPVPRHRVSFESQQASVRDMTRRHDLWPVHSNVDGEFVHHGLPTGERYRVSVSRRDGGRPATAGPYEIEAGRDVEDVEIVLLDPTTVLVRLVSPDETGIESTELYVREPGRRAGAFGAPGGAVSTESIDAVGEGRFEIRLSETGRSDLVFLPAGHRQVEKTGVMLEAGATIDIGTLVAEEGPAIGGRVTDPEGGPIAGAEVTASYLEDSGMRRRSSTSGDDGSYRLGGLGNGPVLVLQVEADGYGGETRESVPTGDLAVDFTLQPDGGVRGLVETAGGEVPPGYSVQLHPEATGGMDVAGMMGQMWGQPEGFSNEDGSFELKNVAPGRYTAEVRAPKMAPGHRRGVEVTSRETTDVGTIVLEEGLAVSGRVLIGADDSPLLGASVEAQDKSGGITAMVQRMSRQGARVSSDEEGRFRIEGLAPGGYTLAVDHPEFAGATEAVTLEADSEPGEVVVRLHRGGTLTGTVRDESGQPVHEAHIIVFQNLFEMDQAHMATTDHAGSYGIRKIPAGSYQAMRAPGEDGGSMLSMKAKTAVIREGEITVLDFGDATPITLEGAVRRGTRPLGDAMVTFMPAGGTAVTDVKATQADASGRYEIGLDHPGTYRVMVQTGAGSPSGSQGTSTVEIVVPDEPRSTRDIVLRTAGVTGRVTDERGEPLAPASVTAIRDDRTQDLWAQIQGVTDSEGRYALEGLEPGNYRLTAGAEGYRSASTYPVAIDGDRSIDGIDFQLDQGSMLRGVLLDPQGGGLQGAFVLVAPTGTVGTEGIGQAMTDVNGAFTATTPGDGALDLTAIAQGWAPARLVGVMPSPDPDDPGFRLQAVAGGRARVRVQTGDDQPRAGVRLQVRADPAFLGSDLLQLLNPSTPTDADGTTVMTHLAPGEYTISVTGRDDLPPTRITVMSDVETSVILRVD